MTDRNLRGSTIEQTKRLRRECLPSDALAEESAISLDAGKVECRNMNNDCNVVLVKTEFEDPVSKEVGMGETKTYHNLGENKAKEIVDKEVDGEDEEGCGFESTKQLFLRRQPRRFAHIKTFSNGVADRATADWLKEHFQTKRGSLVPKGFLCDRYEEFCLTTGWKPMNNATLGRFIRGVFRGLETRRLGARQQSRYFYNNLGVRPSSNFGQLMMRDKRPSFIRRHRNRPGNNIFTEEEPQRYTPSERTLLVIPNYLLNSTQRRLENARLVHVELQGKESMETILNRLDADGYQSLLASAVQNEILILELWEEINSDSKIWFGELRQQNVQSRGVEDIDWIGFLTDFSTHLKIFCRAVLIFDLDEIPALMKKFWLDNEESIGGFQEAISVKVVKQSLRNLISWQPLQDLIHRTYLKYHGKLLSALLPADSNSVVSANEYVWTALHVISTNYGTLMELVTIGFPESFRPVMMREAWAFCEDLRERLNWSYAVAYINKITANDRLSGMIKNVFCDVFDNTFTAEFLFSLMGHQSAFEEGLRRFCQAEPETSVPDSWVTWFTALVQSMITEGDDSAKSLAKLGHLRSSWVTLLALFHGSIPPFDGDFDNMSGVFDFLVRAVSRVVNRLMEKLTGKTSIEAYAEKICLKENESVSLEPHNFAAQWWPDFLRGAVEARALPAQGGGPRIKSESPEPGNADVTVKVAESQIEESFDQEPGPSRNSQLGFVRVSGRVGKGRNRWLDFDT